MAGLGEEQWGLKKRRQRMCRDSGQSSSSDDMQGSFQGMNHHRPEDGFALLYSYESGVVCCTARHQANANERTAPRHSGTSKAAVRLWRGMVPTVIIGGFQQKRWRRILTLF